MKNIFSKIPTWLAEYLQKTILSNPYKFKFTIVIFIHYKPRIAVPILDL